MEASKVIHAIYTDDDVLMSAVKKVKAERHHIEEIYTPFPVHGLDKAMGLAPTRIAITSFMYGCVGLIVSIVMMNYMMLEENQVLAIWKIAPHLCQLCLSLRYFLQPI